MTGVERLLWQLIRSKQRDGYRFRRQHPIGRYIADFACLDKKCVVELDGGQHQEQVTYERRTIFLQAQGWRVLRFWNSDVAKNLDGVYRRLQLLWMRYPHPDLLPQGERDFFSLS